MWIEKSELEELSNNIKKIYGIIVTFEDKENDREIEVKLSTNKPTLEALIREVAPSPNAFVLKYTEKQDGRYKVEYHQFTSFLEEVRYNARLLHARMFNLERELSKIADSEVW
ncbi:MAG: hypothetical protein OH337_04070 [Candidatus Parvarchaeota archaeon]|nr:hypothetical protein [Candidatus Haiyanarchaeum thermophilum]